MDDGVISARGVMRWLSAAMLIAMIAAGALFIRLTALSAQHWNEAARAEQSGDHEAAFESLLWVLRNYYPGNPYSRQAVVRALSYMEEPNDSTDRQTVLAQLKDLRAVLLSIRSFYQPYSSVLDEVNARLQVVESGQ